MLPRFIRRFLALESASGLLLVAAALLALAVSNSSLQFLYDGLLQLELEIRLGTLQLEKPLLLWINDGLMAVFFFLVGLELKRELVVGELRSPAQLMLPGIAAIGGMAMPAVVYLFINQGDPDSMAGWAIPAATDIAFALGVLSLLGSRVPPALKLFLLTLAVIDDLLAMDGISSVQTTFHETLPPNLHAMPPGGFRLAIVNCHELGAGLAARDRLRRFHGV